MYMKTVKVVKCKALLIIWRCEHALCGWAPCCLHVVLSPTHCTMLHVSRQQLHNKLCRCSQLHRMLLQNRELLTLDVLQHTWIHAGWFVTLHIVTLQTLSMHLQMAPNV